MNKKTILLSVLMTLLILGAFAAPNLILKSSVKHSIQDVKLLDASDYTINSLENIIEKLNCYRYAPVITTASMSLETDPESVKQLLKEELGKLYGFGALRKEIYEYLTHLITEHCVVERICVIHPERQLVFDEYELQFLGGEFEAALDVSSGKLLWLRCIFTGDEILWNEMNDENFGEKQLRGWANYFGLTLQEVRRSSRGFEDLASYNDPLAEFGGAIIYRGRMRDSSGEEVFFGLHYEFSELDMVEQFSWTSWP